MSNGGKTVAIGAAAAAAVLGGKELLIGAKFAAVTTTHVAEISASKIAVVTEGVGANVGGSANGMRSGAKSLDFGSTPQMNFDTSGSLANSMRIGKLADAKANQPKSFSPFQDEEKLAPPIVTSRPAVIFNNQDFSVSGVSSYFSNAQPKLSYDLASLKPPLSKATVEKIVEQDLKDTAENAAKNPNSKATFEVLSGKLKIESSTTISGLKIAGGEVNVYAVAGTITGGVMACNALTDASFKTCVDAAIKTAVSSFVKDPGIRGKAVNAD